MTASPARLEAPVDSPRWFLHQLNPLAKIAATAPAIVLLIFVRGLAIPSALLGAGMLTLLFGTRLTARLLIRLLIGLPLLTAVMALSFAIWTDPAQYADTATVLELGSFRLTSGAFSSGLGTSLRLCAIIVLSLVPALTSEAADISRSLVQQLGLPYRVGYAAIAAFQFVPLLTNNLAVIQAAHRSRGLDSGRGPIAALRRWTGWIVPLLAGGIRHAERVALAMDSRGFGAHPTRTERHLVPFRVRDAIFVAASWAITLAVALNLWNR